MSGWAWHPAFAAVWHCLVLSHGSSTPPDEEAFLTILNLSTDLKKAIALILNHFNSRSRHLDCANTSIFGDRLSKTKIFG
jgi:hypothetical protein